jgi:hypothetical protein
MDQARALNIVTSLAHGVNPMNGEVFPADSVYNAPDIVRALFVAVEHLRPATDDLRVRPTTRPTL